jgi:hypothetical protein
MDFSDMAGDDLVARRSVRQELWQQIICKRSGDGKMTFSAERQAQKSMSGSVFPEAHQDRSTFLARGTAELP